MPQGLVGKIIDYTKDSKTVEFLYYNDISDNYGAVYDEPDVRGRSEEHIFYQSTKANTYSFDIQLVASVNQADGGTPEKIYNDYLFIKSFQYPDYGLGYNGPILPPRKVLITIGKFFRKQGVITEPSGTFLKPYDENGYPYVIEVRFTLRVINPRPLDLNDIRRGL